MKSFFLDPTTDTDDFYNAYHHRDEADWDKIYENYSAAVDWPTATFYKDLMVKYPDAKVLLTVRSADSWYKSMKNTVASGLNDEPKQNDPKMQKFFKMVRNVCGEGKIMNPTSFADEEAIKKLFLEHNEEVKRHVPADRLLVLELGEGWNRLCTFLGKDVPDTPYPSANSTEEFNNRFKEHKEKLEENSKKY